MKASITPPKRHTHLLDDPHERMLLRLCKPLYPFNDLLVVLALYGDSDSEAAHNEGSVDIVVLRDGLQVGHLQCARRLVQYLGEVLCHEPVQPLQRAEPQDPVVRGLRRGPPGLAEVLRVAERRRISLR